jgi:hypothetical protein
MKTNQNNFDNLLHGNNLNKRILEADLANQNAGDNVGDNNSNNDSANDGNPASNNDDDNDDDNGLNSGFDKSKITTTSIESLNKTSFDYLSGFFNLVDESEFDKMEYYQSVDTSSPEKSIFHLFFINQYVIVINLETNFNHTINLKTKPHVFNRYSVTPIIGNSFYIVAYELLDNTLKFFKFDISTQQETLSIEYNLNTFIVQGEELSMTQSYNEELNLHYIVLLTMRGIFKFDFDSALRKWSIDDSTFSFITGRSIQSYKNYFFVTHDNVLKIVSAKAQNKKISFNIISELTMPSNISQIKIGNLNNILIVCSSAINRNIFWRLNMELLARKTEFPVLNEYMDSSSILTYMVNFDKFMLQNGSLNILGGHVQDKGVFYYYQVGDVVTALELKIRTMMYLCNKTGKLPYYSRQKFSMYVLDHLNENMWFKQNLNFYIYSKKVSIFKSIVSKTVGVLLLILVIFAAISFYGYITTKKKKSAFKSAEL